MNNKNLLIQYFQYVNLSVVTNTINVNSKLRPITSKTEVKLNNTLFGQYFVVQSYVEVFDGNNRKNIAYFIFCKSSNINSKQLLHDIALEWKKAGGFILKYNKLQAFEIVMVNLIPFCFINVADKVLKKELIEVLLGVRLDSLTSNMLIDEKFEANFAPLHLSLCCRKRYSVFATRTTLQ